MPILIEILTIPSRPSALLWDFRLKGIGFRYGSKFCMMVPAQANVGILIGAHERPTGVVEGINERSNHETLIGFIGPDKTGSPV
jgi:hypothetical protein